MNAKHANTLSDQDLVKRVLSGDTNAFGIIIKNTERLVAQIVFKMVKDSEVRKDLAQEVYLKVFRSLSGFMYQSKLSTWIAKITYTTCLHYLERKKPTNSLTSYEDIETMERDMINKGVNDVEVFISNKELAGILAGEIEKLPPIYNVLITLYHNEELSYSEIAQITELPEGTVKNYLFRARKTLKENLLQKYNREAL